jgi:GxxExxY protein
MITMEVQRLKKQFAKIPDETEKSASIVVDSAYHVHKKTGPGLLERNYERFLEIEINRRGHEVKRQVKLPIKYDGMECGEYYIIS